MRIDLRERLSGRRTKNIFPSRRTFITSGMIGSVLALDALRASTTEGKSRWPVGHHFWNWDHAWNDADHLDIRLRLTKDTGYDGFEAKPAECGVSAEILKEKCAEFDVRCAAIGGSLQEAIDYAFIVGAHVVRSGVPKEETKRWVDYAGERDIVIVIHNHIGRPGHEGPPNIETGEDMLRYLDERPGVFACPDTGHLALCGSDPAQTIRDLGDRCRYIHLKDIHPAVVGLRRNVPNKFPALGAGALDVPGVLQALEDIDYDGWLMVERDSRTEDYERSARTMRKFLQKQGY